VTNDILGLVLLLPILLLSMMAHEVAHGYVAFRLGDPTAKLHGRLTLNPLKHLDPLGTAMFVITYLGGSFIFGWAKPVPVNAFHFRDRQRGMLIVGIAGPFMNFVIAVLIALVLNLVAGAGDKVLSLAGSTLVLETLFLAYQVNIVLGLFNLLPIPPLDGSRVVGGFLPPELYQRWLELDRYGMFIILAIFFIFNQRFFALLAAAFEAVSRVLLPAYF
jgi:Zn-dependent protease